MLNNFKVANVNAIMDYLSRTWKKQTIVAVEAKVEDSFKKAEDTMFEIGLPTILTPTKSSVTMI